MEACNKRIAKIPWGASNKKWTVAAAVRTRQICNANLAAAVVRTRQICNANLAAAADRIHQYLQGPGSNNLAAGLRDMTAAHRPATRLLAAAGLLAALAVLSSPLAAHAQLTTETLISNTGQRSTSSSNIPNGGSITQPFTTGTPANGEYRITRVVIDVAFNVPAAGRDALSAEIRSDDGSGNPDTRLASLTVPDTIAAGANNFDVTEGSVKLDGGTTYHIVLELTGMVQDTERIAWKYAQTASTDSATNTGWSAPLARSAASGSTTWDTLTFNLARLLFQVIGVDAAANREPVGQPQVTTTAASIRVGTALRARTRDISDPDGPATLSFTYQWRRADDARGTGEEDIPGANLPPYTISRDEAGKYVQVVAIYTDNGLTRERVGSDWTEVLNFTPSLSYGPPTISGTAMVDQTLTAMFGRVISGFYLSGIFDRDGGDPDSLDGFTFQWRRADDAAGTTNAVDIPDTDSSSYTLTTADAGKYIQVVLSYIDGGGTEESFESAWTSMAVTAAAGSTPTGTTFISNVEKTVQGLDQGVRGQAFITGSDTAGYTISGIDLHVGVVGSATASDPWRVAIHENSSDVPSASALYTMTAPAGMTANAVNSFTAPANAFLSANTRYHVVVSLPGAGTPSVGRTGVTDGVDGTPAAGWSFPEGLRRPTGNSWTGPSGARRVMVRIRGTVGGMAVSSIAVEGTPRVDVALSVNISRILDPHATNPNYMYQWERADDTAGAGLITVGTAATYTPVKADQNKLLRVTVSYTDDNDNAATITSDWTGSVERRAPSSSSGDLEITGIARVGRTLTTTYRDIMDANGFDEADFRYEWLRQHPVTFTDTPITGATESTYRLTIDDQGSHILARINFTDLDGYRESVESDVFPSRTDVIEAQAANTEALGEVTIDDGATAQVDVQLSAVTTTITDTTNGLTTSTFAYQWERASDVTTDPTNPVGLTDVGDDSANYTPVATDQGMFLRVTVTFTDDDGHEETKTSEWTRAVAAVPMPMPPPTGTVFINNLVPESGALANPSIFNLTGTREFAQGFRTGSNASGYVLGSVELLFPNSPAAISVQIREDDGSDAPGSAVLYQLVSPASISAGTAVSFSAPADATLDASTKYHVVVLRTSSSNTSGNLRLRLGADPQVIGTPAAGWSIDGQMYWKSHGGAAWGDQFSDNHIALRIRGEAAAGAMPALPEVTVAASAASVVGGSAGPAVFTLTRTGDPVAALTVGIAITGTHTVSSPPTTAMFSATMATVDVSVPTTAITGAGETVILTVQPDSGSAYTVGTDNTATVNVTAPTVMPALPEVTVAAKTGGESVVGGSAGPAVFTLTRTGDPAAALTVGIAITGTHTVSSPPRAAMFSATMATVDVSVPTTAVTGAGETVILTVQPDSGSTYTVGAADTATVNVTAPTVMPALPEVTVAASAASVVGGSAGPAVFTLTRTGDPAAALTVGIAITGTHAVSSPPTTAMFSATMATVDVSVPTTAITGAGETVILTVQPGDGSTYTVGAADTATVNVTAPPLPEVTVAASAASVVGGSAGPAVFTLTRTGDPAAALTVGIAITGTHAVSSPPTTAMFSATMATVDVSVPTTALTGAGETVILTVQPGDGSTYTVGAADTATVNVTAPPLPEVTVAASAASVVGGSAGPAVFTLTRTGDPAAALTVGIAITGTHTVSSPPTTAMFQGAMATVDVSVPTTAVTGAGETVILTVQPDSGSTYTVGAAGTATVNVTPRALNRGATGMPTVTGRVAVSWELVAGVGDIADHNGLPQTMDGYRYQWRRADDAVGTINAVNIASATSATYTPNREDDLGKHLQVVVSFTDGDGYPERRAGAWTAAVEDFDPDAQAAEILEATQHSLALLAPNLAANTVHVLTARFENMGGGAPASAANLGGRPLGALAGAVSTDGAGRVVSAAHLTREVAGLFGLNLPAAGRSAAEDSDTGSAAAPVGMTGMQGAFEAQDTAAHIFDAQNTEAHVGRGRGAGDTGDFRAFDLGSPHEPELRSLLSQSGFSVQLGAAHDARGGAGGGSHWTVWGRGTADGFEGREKDSALFVEGENIAAYLGADLQRGDLALGLAVGWSSGKLDYAGRASDTAGELETDLTSVHPYLHWSGGENISIYAMLGYGSGEATLDDAGLIASLESDLEMRMLAAGIRNTLSSSASGRRYDLKLDAFWVDLESDGADATTQDRVQWHASDTQSRRVRLSLAGAFPLLQGLWASGELAARVDGGGAQSGSGMEVGAGLNWMRGGFSVVARGRMLLVHSEGEFEDYEEQGAHLSASYQATGAGGRGLRFTLSPAWGDAQSGADALYESAGALRELGDGGRRGERRQRSGALPDRLDFELGYGLSALGGRAGLLPFGRLSLAGDLDTRLRLGTRFDLPQRAGDALSVHRLGFEFFGEERMGDIRDRRVALELTLGF